MAECCGVVKRAAEWVGLSERNFHVKLRKYGLTCEQFRTMDGARLRRYPNTAGFPDDSHSGADGRISLS